MKKPNMRSELVEITPVLATKWLELNNDNRNISDRWVDAIASDIAAGKWDPNNATLGIITDEHDEPAKVADGQHRLWAVVKSGKSIWTWVIFGDEQSLRRENIDRVKPRSIADQLQLLFGVKNARKVQAYCGVLKSLEMQQIDHGILTLEQTMSLRERYAVALDWVINAIYGGSVVGARLIDKAGVAGALAYAYPSAADRVDRFTAQVRDGESIIKTDPAYALRVYLAGSDRSRERQARHETTVMTLRAVMAAIKGEKLSALKPGAIMGGGFYREACRYFGRAWNMGPGVTRRRVAAANLTKDDK